MTLSLHSGAEILYSLALAHARRTGTTSRYPLSDYSLMSNARRNLGLFQHHDAITGTAKEAVAVDYGVRCVPGAGAQPQGVHPGLGLVGTGLVGTGLGVWLRVGDLRDLSARGRCGISGGVSGMEVSTVLCGSICLCLRLLHSLTDLKHVIINAAHYLVLGDKNTFHHDPAAPFLGTVSSTLPTTPCAAAWDSHPCAPGTQPCLPCWAGDRVLAVPMSVWVVGTACL